MDELDFSGKVLDNVHGFIPYTAAEEKIINTHLFKRLQSIKQLSIANWVFPGSEHTRYIHSLGVMFIADKIAVKLGLSGNDRKIIRMAGLLHDIGHYPLSHVCEYPYKKSLEDFNDKEYCKTVNENIKNRIDDLSEAKRDYQYMEQSAGYHHEKIGANIICNNEEIRKIVVEECGEGAPDIIADMIIGNTERETTNPLFVQILHSELDADGIDYLMRDAVFSGTSFGTFELDQLIGCMEIGEYNKKKILCINPKGIAAADQYLINKFFSYSQVVFNKHISITEFMAEQIVNWMQKNNAFFPKNEILGKWVKSKDEEEKYIGFTDNFFWASLQQLLDDPLKDTEPKFIRFFCEKLLNHSELEYEENSEVKIISNDPEEIQKTLKEAKVYQTLLTSDSCLGILNDRVMSKQIPEKQYDEYLNGLLAKNSDDSDSLDSISEEDITDLRAKRYMECITIKDGSVLKLLCDDKRSLMKTLCNHRLIILRAFKCDGVFNNT